MPPRKRAETKPADPVETATDEAAEETAPAEAAAAEEPSSGSESKPTAKRKQHTDPEPCTECFPGGWPDGSTGLGCEHGTWSRDNT